MLEITTFCCVITLKSPISCVSVASQADGVHGISCVPQSVFSCNRLLRRNRTAVVWKWIQGTLVRCPSAALHIWVIKRDLAKIHILRLHKILKNLLERPKKIPGVDLLSVEANEHSVISRSDSER